MIHISNLFFQYPRSSFALSIERLSVQPREKVAVIGPSGSGKTTLLNLIAGIDTTQADQLTVAGHDLLKMNSAKRRNFRVAEIGFIFQRFELIEYLTVEDNIRFPFLINNELQQTKTFRNSLVELATAMSIDGYLKRYPAQLSQGEKQRVAICRALIASPQLLIADEPTGNLDPRNKQTIIDLIFQHVDQSPESRSLLVVTHDMAVAKQFDRVIDFATFHQDSANHDQPSPRSVAGSQA